jgi:general secretion pathway protein D
VAPLLSQLVSGQNSAAQKTGSVRANQFVQPNTPAAPNQPPAPTIAALDAAVASVGGTNEFSSLLTILPDERSNAVVVSGTVDDIRLLRELVDKIDVILAQVRIEVVIAEVTLNDTDKSGLDALNLTIGQHGGVTRVTNFSAGTDAASNGPAGWAITGGVVNPLAFNAIMGDTGSKSNVKVLSAPTIVTTHNKEAEIIVGQSQPIITSSTTYPTSTTTDTIPTTSQVTYKDIAIDLKVTPLIGDDGSIQLKIDQKVDDILGNVTVSGNVQPIIGRRQATSFVNVMDAQMIVLGGLQRTKNTRDRTKLGFLWEIPILSHLLGARTNAVERTELLLFIRPHVIRPQDGTADTQKTIDTLSNREQINTYLIDPSKTPKPKLIDRIK